MTPLDQTPDGPDLTPIARLTRDLKSAARLLTDAEARFVVDAYYAMQEDRIRAAHQMRTLGEGGEPNSLMVWLLDQRESLEKQVARALDAYSAGHVIGEWMRSQIGIGPIIAAGMLAHIDIKRAPTAGHIWRYAGLDPTVQWKKGEKRPWNAGLKRLQWLLGESFVKVSGNPDALYGQLYKQRKEIEERKNAAGDFAEQATASLAAKKFGTDTQARKHYEAGHLPPARIHLRAKRWATKLFLSHLQEVWWEHDTGTKPPAPYAMVFAGHAHKIPPPNWPMVG
jgi:hypothetical protein